MDQTPPTTTVPTAPPAGRQGDLRVSDAERDRAASRLREHAGTGRLTVDELVARLEAALAARTRGELDALFADLPGHAPRAPHVPRRAASGLRIHTRTYLWVSLGLIGLWALTGMGYFWPLWPVCGWGIGVVSHARSCGLQPRFARPRGRPGQA